MNGQPSNRRLSILEDAPDSVALGIRKLFEDILKTTETGEGDDFFSLGGQSIDAANLISKIGEKFGILLPLMDFFDDPTVRGVEKLLRRQVSKFEAGGQIESASAFTSLRDMSERFALNEVQHAYWIGRSSFFTLGNIGTHAYVEYSSRELEHGRLQNAWNKLIERHPMLRTVIDPDGSQRTLPSYSYSIALNDVRDLPDEEQDKLQYALRDRMSHQLLDTTRPMYELVMTCKREVCILHCSLDLIIADLWSTQIIFRELERYYLDPEACLAPLTFRFQDYLFSESDRVHQPAYERARKYWAERLHSLPPGPALPLGKPPSEIKKPHFTRRRAVLPIEKWERLRQLATHHKITPSVLLATAFSDVLARWSSSNRFTLNLTLFNRAPLDPQVNDIVGDFTTLTLLEIDHDPVSGFVERARHVQRQLWQDLDHRHYSGVNVIRDYARRTGKLECTFPVVFTSSLVHGSSTNPAFLGEQVYGISQTPQIWLDHQIFEDDQGLIFQWDAVEELFPKGLLDDMFSSQCTYLEHLAEQSVIENLSVSPRLPDWQTKMFSSVNNTQSEQAWSTLLSGFNATVHRHPDRIAVVAGDVRLTYMELNARVQRLAGSLLSCGVGSQSLVPVCMSKGWEQVVAVLAIQFAGGAYVPVDIALPLARISELISMCGAAVLLTQQAHLMAHRWPDSVNVLDVTDIATQWFRRRDEKKPLRLPTADSLAYVIFTSGSTGKPKGVAVSHGAASNTICDLNHRFGIRQDDTILAVSSLSFDLSVYDIYGMLFAGGKIVIPLQSEVREPSEWMRLLRDEGITVWNSVPSIMAMLLNWLTNDRESRLNSLRVALLSGDWIPASMPLEIGTIAPNARVIALGGATEASIWSNYFLASDPHPHCTSVPYGKPLGNQSYRVLGADGRDCPVWVPGDLIIEGAGVAVGYLNDRARTEAAFFVDKETGARAYKTGDKGRYLPDGNIEFLGRIDHQVKINGYRVELGEIEHALKAVEGIENAVVTVMPDEKNTARLTAYVTTARSAPYEVRGRARESGALTDFARIIDETRRFAQVKAQSIIPELWKNASALLDHTVAGSIYDVLVKLGAFDDSQEWASVAQIKTRTGLRLRYEKWLRRALELLVTSAYLEEDNEHYRCVDAGWVRGTWQDVIRVVGSLGLSSSGVEFAARSATVLDAILTGREEAVGSLFENGNAMSAVEMYKNEFSYINEVASDAFKRIVAQLPEHRPIRILEVGAGIGSTTTYLLPHLRDRRAHYVYSDISRYFLNFAEKEFDDYDCIEFAILNIEDELMIHSIEQHSFDVIVAASVLHATKSIGNTLDNLSHLLTESGVLMIIEETRFPPVFNLTMGLQQGFDEFEDYALRPAHPLLSYEGWRHQLEARGYYCSPPIAAKDSASELLGVELILAQGPAVVTRFDSAYVLNQVERSLPDYMVPAAIIRLKSIPLSDNGKVNRHILPSPWKRQAHPSKDITPPDTTTEKLVFSVYSLLLGTESFGVDESFFDLGGDSLLATSLAGKLTAELSFNVPVRWIFELPTVMDLSRRIDKTIPLAKASKEFAGLDGNGSA